MEFFFPWAFFLLHFTAAKISDQSKEARVWKLMACVFWILWRHLHNKNVISKINQSLRCFCFQLTRTPWKKNRPIRCKNCNNRHPARAAGPPIQKRPLAAIYCYIFEERFLRNWTSIHNFLVIPGFTFFETLRCWMKKRLFKAFLRLNYICIWMDPWVQAIIIYFITLWCLVSWYLQIRFSCVL